MATDGRGHIVGSIDDGSSPNVAAVFDGARGWRRIGGPASSARDIDGFGRVVGQHEVAPGSEVLHASLWVRERPHDLGALGDGRDATATAINDRGEIVGYSQTGRSNTTPYHAFLFRDGRMIDLGAPGGVDSVANDIAPDGTVVGHYTQPSGETVACRWKDGDADDLPSLGGAAEANAINRRGDIVGVSLTPANERHAYRTDGSSARDLGTLGGKSSVALNINDNGDIVGSAELADGAMHAFVVPRGRAMVDLDQLAAPEDIVLREARDIDQSGRIVVNGRRASGQEVAFLLVGCR